MYELHHGFRRVCAHILVAGLALPLFGGVTMAGASSQTLAAPGATPALDFTLDAAKIKANCATALSKARAQSDRIVKGAAAHATFAGVVRPLEDLTADLTDELVSEMFLSTVSSDRAVRDASLACQNDVNDYETALQAEPALYRAVASAVKGGGAKTLPDRKLAEVWLTLLMRSGAALPAVQRKEFVQLGQRLNALQDRYGANLANDKTTVALSQAQLAGLPPDFTADFVKHGDEVIVPVDESTVGRFLENATDPSARRAYYFAINNRAYPANSAVLQEAIAVRDRSAHLLGYRSWADFVLADRMAATPQRVDAFLSGLDAKLLPAARRTLATLTALKAADTGVPSAVIEPWDVIYYNNQLLKTKYAVDADSIRAYFPVEHVEHAVFDIYSTLLGIRFTQRVPGNVWSPDVTEWAVSDAKSGRYIGDFYLDLFPRDGKYTHFANFPLLPARRLADGTMRPPLSAIVGNWPKPAPGKPALLSHDDVETFFHEFGHNMAALLTTAPYETLSSGFRWDFIEAPSQMLENWVWDPQILKQLSANVDTGAPLPDDLIAKIRAARVADALSSFNAYSATRQIMLSQIDMAYHSGGAKVDLTGIWARIAAADSPLAQPAGVHPEASFGHLMGGYDAGYYGYLWSRVYAQDMFSAFQAGGLESPLVGARYRKYILEPAREIEPDQEVRAFLGRPMSPNAFYSALGISASPSR